MSFQTRTSNNLCQVDLNPIYTQTATQIVYKEVERASNKFIYLVTVLVMGTLSVTSTGDRYDRTTNSKLQISSIDNETKLDADPSNRISSNKRIC